MAFISSVEYSCVSTLVDIDKLDIASFNPGDYIDFSSMVKTQTTVLEKIADVESTIKETSGFTSRVMSNEVDRVTGEVHIPKLRNYNQIQSVQFQKGDILVHKYASRIGRIGISEFDGNGVNHFLIIRTKQGIDRYYLLLALRCSLVLAQLPFRETARPGIRTDDLKRLLIPRLDDQLEQDIGLFISEVFYLRKKTQDIFSGLLRNFNKAIHHAIPKEDCFLVDVEVLESGTFLPGRYRIESLQNGFKNHVILDGDYSILEPPYLCAGDIAQVLTINDFRPEGVMPEKLKDSVFLKDKNYANIYDVLLNRMESSKRCPFKATIVLPDSEYLRIFGLSVEGEGIALKLPVYEHILILKRRRKESISPFYLLLVLNSDLMHYLIGQIRIGSTGLIYIPQTILGRFRIPLFEEKETKMLSDAVEICVWTFSRTLRMLAQISKNYSALISGTAKEAELISQIKNDREELRRLTSNASIAEKTAKDTEALVLQ